MTKPKEDRAYDKLSGYATNTSSHSSVGSMPTFSHVFNAIMIFCDNSYASDFFICAAEVFPQNR